MKLYYPKNGRLEELFLELEQNPPFKNYKGEHLKYILHLITALPAYNKDLLTEDGFTPINAEILEKVVYRYKDYLDVLYIYEVIECDNHFVIGQKSRGYKITEEYTSTDVTVYEPKDYFTRKAIRKINNPSCKATDGVKHITKWLHGFEINKDLCFSYIEEDYRMKMSNPDLWDKKKKRKKDGRVYERLVDCPVKPWEQKVSSIISTDRISDGEYLYSVDKTSHRLHTPFTNQKSKHRNFLTYKGASLASVDVKNSQPYFSTVTTNTNFWTSTSSNTVNLKSLGTKINNISNLSNNIQYKTVITLLNNTETKSQQGFQEYIDLVVKGELYEFLAKKYYEKTGIKITDRKVLKEFVFQTFFTDNRYIAHPDAEFKRLFKDLFPDVYKLFYVIKQGKKNNLAVLLQTLESHLILNVVCKRIATELPKLPITTIHDSIVTLVGHEHYVDAILKEELEKAIGHSPTTSIEYWRPENAKFNDGSYFNPATNTD